MGGWGFIVQGEVTKCNAVKGLVCSCGMQLQCTLCRWYNAAAALSCTVMLYSAAQDSRSSASGWGAAFYAQLAACAVCGVKISWLVCFEWYSFESYSRRVGDALGRPTFLKRTPSPLSCSRLPASLLSPYSSSPSVPGWECGGTLWPKTQT